MIPFEDTAGMRTVLLGTILAVCSGLIAGTGRAQQVLVAGPPPAGTDTTNSDRQQRIGDNHSLLIGHVEIVRGDMQIFADQVEIFSEQDRAIGTGNVVLSQANSRIAADRAEFNLKTKLGTFYNAWGTAPLAQQKTRGAPAAGPSAALAGGLFGNVSTVPAPQAPKTAEDTDVYFFGDTIEKQGPRKYKITNGGFTTCVQPTPRWELTSATVILNLDHYTALRHAVFRVKGVPMLYTPFLYYPTKKEDRATGILLPTYGSSTLRGQSIHNGFFWAIDRSEDATLMYDWFSQAGQGVGSEYRYNFGGGSDGNFRAYLLNEKAADDTTSQLPSRSYEFRGSLNQALPGRFRAKANVNYFSSLTSMQTFNTNIYDASRNNRTFGGNLVGVVGDFSVNGTFNRSEYFYNATDSATSGTWPRVSLSRSERPVLGSPAYFSIAGDYGRVLRDNTTAGVDTDWSLNRFEVFPQIRYPFTKWQWFTINSTVSWRDTYYSRSLSPDSGNVVDVGLNRQYFDVQSQISGPVFTRVWNTPDSGYAEKLKHSIEPFLQLDRTSAIDNFDRIVQLEGGDSIIGGATRYAYGIANRFYAKRRRGGVASSAREIASVEVAQSYYTDPRSAQYDSKYSTSYLGASPSNYSPISVSGRASPTDAFNATFRTEIDSHYLALRTISANGAYTVDWLTTSVGWSKKAFIAGLPAFNDLTQLDQYINTSTSAHTRDNRFGGVYSMNYDVLHSQLLQQRLTGFYNSQCCGLSFEYQVFNFSNLSVSIPGVTADHRFFMSFTLAGLGNFSPFNGALSGAPH